MAEPHRRRPRYPGRNPRRFEQKYKEHRRDPETLARLSAAGRTPAGAHQPIMVDEILQVLQPVPGEIFVDGTLGFGGHASRLLAPLQPGGKLLGLDVDPVELPKATARLRAAGFGEDRLVTRQSNFAGLPRALVDLGWPPVDGILIDLGVSSMQLDDPARGFSFKVEGPLDMRMNPGRGETAARYLERVSTDKFAQVLWENADEPHADLLAAGLAGRSFHSTAELRRIVENLLAGRPEIETSVRRVFQAIRIAVNDEFSALTSFLRDLPQCLAPGGRAAILTFHSGEDRRVKQAFKAGLHEGDYSAVAREVTRASFAERHANPRSTAAKLRWAIRSNIVPAADGRG